LDLDLERWSWRQRTARQVFGLFIYVESRQSQMRRLRSDRVGTGNRRTRREGTGLGVVGGAVVGGVIGHQIGGGRGKDLATVAGAVGGAVAGNEIEKRAKSTKSYAITIRLDDGSSRVINETNPPTWRPGDRVEVADGTIRSTR
jgi:outer membrane lipoprotein SlyB